MALGEARTGCLTALGQIPPWRGAEPPEPMGLERQGLPREEPGAACPSAHSHGFPPRFRRALGVAHRHALGTGGADLRRPFLEGFDICHFQNAST